ncbi:inverse autotransporter beta domain-containing protein [Kalamiella sp. sgz302252]|uniref:inverse autotransporter beta domain-containing protein n=1 Tax=Pantoea sp. sgz302252 TaxID=3341827 RepID=UPI0036D28A80
MNNKPEVNKEENKTNKPLWLQRLTWLTIAVQGAFPVACAITPTLAAAQQHFLTRPAEHDSDAGEAKAASLAAQAGASLDSRYGNGATAAAANMAAGEAGTVAQQWLSRFGTARVQLDADKNFSLKNSQFDLLLPLSDRADRLIFTQGSFHRTDDRNQANLGLGIRHFGQGFMTGANTFLDYDLSRDHARSGLGVEYWRDFVKVSANGYVHLTSWKDSKDFADYQERPANGWDIRTEAYLPAWPQLGAKLNYEQYYGNQVALFGNDNRQKNPHAITAGVTYTPFPLLTLEAEQRAGKGGENDTRFGLELNYQIGASWQQQLSGDAVSSLRSLKGNRYDLVNRNNNIVLDYRKNEVIRLSTASLVTGHTGEQKSLNVSVNSKYSLAHIDWSAADLIANGGKIVADGPASYSVVLPAWHNGSNTYTISAVAVDSKGNSSNRAETQVTVSEAEISVNKSSLTPANSILPADGHSQQTLTLAVKDAMGNPVDINEKEISIVKNSQPNGATITSFTRQSAGQYTAVVTAGTQPETFTVTPQARNIAFPSATVTVTADNASARLSSLTVIKNNAVADGHDQDQLKAIVTDAQGNRLAGETVSFTADHDAAIAQSATTNAQGELTVSVSDTKSGLSNVSARVGGDTKEASVNFVAGEAAQFDMVAVTRKTSVTSGDPLIVRVSAKDANGNPVANQRVTIKSDRTELQLPSSVMLQEDGTALFNARTTYSAPYFVTGSLNGQSKTVELDFTPGQGVASHSPFIADKKSVPADGVSEIKLVFTPSDIYNNTLSSSNYMDHSKDIHFDLSGLPGSKIVRYAYYNGTYTFKIVSTRAGAGTIKAQYENTDVIKSLNLNFTNP